MEQDLNAFLNNKIVKTLIHYCNSTKLLLSIIKFYYLLVYYYNIHPIQCVVYKL